MGDGGSGSTQEPMVKYIYGIYWFDVALFFLDDLRFLGLNGKNNFNLVCFGYQDVDVVKSLQSQLDDAMKMIQSLKIQQNESQSPAVRTTATPPSSAGKTTTSTPSPATSAKTKPVKPAWSIPTAKASPPAPEDKAGSTSWTLLIARILFPEVCSLELWKDPEEPIKFLNPRLPIKISIP